MPVIDGVGPDQPTITNADGASQSDTPYRCDLLDGQAILELAKVLKRGADKCGENNWRKISVRDHINHALAHILADQSGDTQDDHLEHASCRMMMAVACKLGSAWPGDDRFVTPPATILAVPIEEREAI